MNTVSGQNFGLLIAYLLPGFVGLWGVAAISPTVAIWLEGGGIEPLPTVGGFLYVTVASIATGMTLSTIRWALLDRFYQWVGPQRPRWDDAKLQLNLQAFTLMVEHHYRYYQFHANTVIALVWLYAGRRYSDEFARFTGLEEMLLLTLSGLFLLGARDNLQRYYDRVDLILNHPSISKDTIVTNGSHHPTSTPKPASQKAQPKPKSSKPKENKKSSPSR
ncbi:MAG: hypothetical protein AAF711_01080 [Planctomycetota bacterium]